ncbi:site-specific DNA-methyltransferase [Nocardioides sp. S5]|uniref:site-specific DNA-methyltransferase n=1 Tax=Nocardioides sp. S5 TaxID=2017486 RepID=UPI001A8D7807|nr:site-specific DNA-methyltransferase [Nocardioides sp. S5]QSR29125.1 site-specific DNA-methyltransferase [Nocardioides sp. S5]
MRLELTWPNKDKFLLNPKDDTGKPVWVERDHPAAAEVRLTDFTDSVGEVNDADPHADNLLFTGDSLDFLRVLVEVPEYAREYRGKVKLVYIDPPFNTGQTFAHYDDWMEHSTWLSFMRERLLLIKELLAPDGSVWVHLDDAEQHRMRLLMDEIFGPRNFVATFVWERTDIPAMQASVTMSQDYLHVYRGGEAFAPNGFVTEEVADHYNKVDADGRAYCLRTLRMTGPGSARADRPTMWFSIPAPDGTEVWPIRSDGTEGRWRWGPDRVGRDENTLEWVERDGQWEPYRRIYAGTSTRPPATLLKYTDVGSNRIAKLEIRKLFPGVNPFATPKPESLMERVLHIGSGPGDIVLDCFGGSGTTAAVAHKMGRRWLTSEILPATVAEFTRPRLEKVVAGSDTGGISKAIGWAGGGGFRAVTLAESMYEVTPYGVMLADWATNGRFARAVAGQLGFDWEPDGLFSGARGRMRLAVFDGTIGAEEVRHVVAALADKERATIVAQAVLPGAEETLAELSKGSRIRKAPRDLLTAGAQRSRRRLEAAERAVQVKMEEVPA